MKIDIHTHVLPGIDDGAKNWETCLTMLSQSYECGIETVFATPHYEPWNKTATVEEIRTLCKQAKEKLQTERGITMEIYPGCEIYYNFEVVDKLKRGELATLAGSRYVLVEFKPSAQYRELCRAVKEFRDAGYIPIIAHVERYECLKNLERMDELKELGALLQMNLEAIQGNVFHAESNRAKKCLKQGVTLTLALASAPGLTLNLTLNLTLTLALALNLTLTLDLALALAQA